MASKTTVLPDLLAPYSIQRIVNGLAEFGIVLNDHLWRGMQRLFFGNLRALEVEHLYERSWFAVTETCLAMTIFRDEFDIRFIIFFAILLLVKIFHWIAQDRVDFMEQSPNLSLSFHLKMIGVMTLLYIADMGLLYYTVDYTMRRGASMMIIFGFEYTILISLIFSISAKYILHSIDARGEHPWENKSMYIFYLELVVDFFKLITYFLFFAIVVHFYGLPLHIIRDLYMTLRSFIQRCRDLIQYRRATANMNERYPDATPEELAATDRVCIICREEMELPGANAQPVPGAAAPAPNAGGARPNAAAFGGIGGGAAAGDPSTPKKLGCGHIFHFRCLRSWLERQQSCPTCRRSVLADTPQPAAAPGAAPGANGQVPPPAAQGGQIPPVAGVAPGAAFPLQQALQALFNQQGQPQQAQQPPVVPRWQSCWDCGACWWSCFDIECCERVPLYIDPAAAIWKWCNILPTNFCPKLVATTPQVLDHLTDEQLAGLEGRTRDAVINRIKAVQNVQSQLTGVVTQLTQILQLLPEPVPPPPPPHHTHTRPNPNADKLFVWGFEDDENFGWLSFLAPSRIIQFRFDFYEIE
ncbi:hypothetical protein BC829DRAFT_435339 [Chytridium lagenaria]|nr:hypothetical protein BC829DRAFT_435339 [Chytridium lagenaria]